MFIVKNVKSAQEILNHVTKPIIVKHLFDQRTVASIISSDNLGNFKSLCVNPHFDDKQQIFDTKQREYYNLLEIAALSGSVEIFNYLILKHGFSIDNRVGKCVVESGSLELMDKCKENGFDFSNIIDFAVTLGRTKVIDWILENFACNICIYNASVAGNIECIFYLMKSGVDINKSDDKGYTPIIYVARNKHFDVVNFLLNNDAELNVLDPKTKQSLLIIAVNNNEIDTVKILLNKNADIHIVDINGVDAFGYSCKIGNIDILKLFLEKGVEVNKMWYNNYDISPLWIAIRNKNSHIAEYLIENGANVLQINDYNQNLIIVSAQNGCDKIIETLYGLGLDVNFYDECFSTALHYAAQKGLQKTCELLISLGSDLEFKDRSGNTPLHIAATFNHLDIVKILYNHGSEIETRNELGETPLISASKSGHKHIVSYLISKRANIYAMNYESDTAVSLANIHGHINIVSLLIKNGAKLDQRNYFNVDLPSTYGQIMNLALPSDLRKAK